MTSQPIPDQTCTFTRTTKRLDGATRTHTVRIERCDRKVLRHSKDDAGAYWHLSVTSTSEPGLEATAQADELFACGYQLAS